MFAGLFKRSRAHEVPQELYGSVVAQARQPAFFTRFGFQDTVTGRFDLVLLHLFLFSRRLVREHTTIAQSLNQEVFDYFTDDTDRALRELGVGDTSVPKRKKKMIHSFYALVEDFSGPLDAEDATTLRQLVETRFNEASSATARHNGSRLVVDSAALTAYVLAAAKTLDAQPSQRILAGELKWPSLDASSLI